MYDTSLKTPEDTKFCFVVCPIGEAGSPTRKQMDGTFREVIEPVTTKHGYRSEIAIHDKGPGMVTEGIVTKLVEADLVIAEDPLQQRWYAGQVDFWFRNPKKIRPFLYLDANGDQRDLYVNSRPIENIGMLDTIIDDKADGKLWFITSGESYSKREGYLSTGQRAWLA